MPLSALLGYNILLNILRGGRNIEQRRWIQNAYENPAVKGNGIQ